MAQRSFPGILKSLRAECLARLFLTLGAFLPYWRFLTFKVLYITDDRIGSDIFTGELPFRGHLGQLWASGKIPLWSSAIGSGTPVFSVEPLSTLAFSLFPITVALDGWILLLLLIAAHGTYGLARRFGADRIGSVMAGIAFAASGYLTCQLKHTGIIATIVWLPYGLLLLDRFFMFRKTQPAEASNAPRNEYLSDRFLYASLFGLLVAEQVLSGFVQSVYYCMLVYGSFAMYRIWVEWKAGTNRRSCGVALSIITLATTLGIVGGAVIILPLRELGSLSDRLNGMGWAWATMRAYSPENLVTFLFPYANGDISNHTYTLSSLFWEDYAYVGAATFLLAIYAGGREWKRPPILFLVGMTILAYLVVLGPATPVYRLFWTYLPGMKLFRFPTRFLVVVDLGLCLLAARGLTRFRADLQQWIPKIHRGLLGVVAIGICALTALDLFVHQPRQNPIVPASEWLAPPPAVPMILGDNPQARTYLPFRILFHSGAYFAAKGWSDLRPYYFLRDSLEPNTGLYWGIPSADIYAGIAPSWHVDVWGDHNRPGILLNNLMEFQPKAPRIIAESALAKLLGAYGVTHITTPLPIEGAGFTSLGQARFTNVYRVDVASRVRVVINAVVIPDSLQAAKFMASVGFDPQQTVVLHDAPDRLPEKGDHGDATLGKARISEDKGEQLTVECEAPTPAFLLLADTFYPGWVAKVDGVSVPIHRANISIRAVAIPAGRHRVTFHYIPRLFYLGAILSALAVAALFAGLVFAFVSRRSHGAAMA